MIQSHHSIKLIHAYKTKLRHYLITELCNAGDLSKLLKMRMMIPEVEARVILRQIVEGMRDINNVNIIHRDLKLANILLHFPNVDLLSLNKEER
jgi:serine/threonine protein kinase